MDEWEGKNIVTIGGGIGQAPLRPVINYVRDNRDKYGGPASSSTAPAPPRTTASRRSSRSSGQRATACHLSIDVEEEKWPHFVGFVPDLLMEVAPEPGERHRGHLRAARS